jgi:hypothetical protein
MLEIVLVTTYLGPLMRGHAEGRVIDLLHEIRPRDRICNVIRKPFFDIRFPKDMMDARWIACEKDWIMVRSTIIFSAAATIILA